MQLPSLFLLLPLLPLLASAHDPHAARRRSHGAFAARHADASPDSPQPEAEYARAIEARKLMEMKERMPVTATTTVVVEMTMTQTVWVVPTPTVTSTGDGSGELLASASPSVSGSDSASASAASSSFSGSAVSSAVSSTDSGHSSVATSGAYSAPAASSSDGSSSDSGHSTIAASGAYTAPASSSSTSDPSASSSADPSASSTDSSSTSAADHSSVVVSGAYVAPTSSASSSSDSSSVSASASGSDSVSASSTSDAHSSVATSGAYVAPSSSSSDSAASASATDSASVSASASSTASASAGASSSGVAHSTLVGSGAYVFPTSSAAGHSSGAQSGYYFQGTSSSAAPSSSSSASASASASSSASIPADNLAASLASSSSVLTSSDSISLSSSISDSASSSSSAQISSTSDVASSSISSAAPSSSSSFATSTSSASSSSSTVSSSISSSASSSASSSISSSSSASSTSTSTSTSSSASATSTLSALGSTLMNAYYPDWSGWYLEPESVDFTLFDVVDFAFALPTASFGLEFTQDDSSDLLTRLVTHAHAYGKRVKLSIGGWTGSTYFSTICASSANRKTFITNILAAYNSYNLDGIDIDWEYPGAAGASGNAVASDDSANFLLFLTELRAALPTGALISTAAQVWPFAGSDGNPMSDVSGFAAVIDWILIMNYDIFGSSTTPGPNAPLSDGCGNSTQPLANAYAAVASWTAAGMPANQITLGVPAYGYLQMSTATSLKDRSAIPAPPHRRNGSATVSARSSTVTAVNSDGGTTNGQIEFEELISQGVLVLSGGEYVGGGGFTREWDSCSSTPWLRSTKSGQIITYDDPESMSLKGQFAAQAGLRGCNVFSIDGDWTGSSFPLTNAVRSGLGL